MKKRYLVLFGLFILLLLPNKVSAKTLFPTYFKINNTELIYLNNPTSNRFFANFSNNQLSLNLYLTYLEDTNAPSGLFDLPYVVITFLSRAPANTLTFSWNSSCNYSCFNANDITLQYLGADSTYANYYRYALIMSYSKIAISGTNYPYEYYIQDSITINSSSGNFDFSWANTIVTDSVDFTTSISFDVSSQKIITNQNQNTQSIINNQNTNQQQTHSDLTNINDSLTNDNIPTDSFNGTAFGEWKDLLPSDTPITDLLLLPVNFLSAFIVGFGGTCQPFNLGNFFGTDLILPCINPATYLGSSLWTIIDIICSGLMCFAISKKLIKIWDDMTDMRDNLTNDLYGGGR